MIYSNVTSREKLLWSKKKLTKCILLNLIFAKVCPTTVSLYMMIYLVHTLFILCCVSLKPDMIAICLDNLLSLSMVHVEGVLRGKGSILDFLPLTIRLAPPPIMPDYIHLQKKAMTACSML